MHSERLIASALLLSSSLLLGAESHARGAEPPISGPPQDDAEEALMLAEEAFEAGKYTDAFRRFARIADRWPETYAGRQAADKVSPGGLLGYRDTLRHGADENRVQVVLMQDGCELSKQKAFDDLASDVPAYFEQDQVFGEYFTYLNFTQAHVVSAESGIDGFGREADTALGAYVISGSNFNYVSVDQDAVHAVVDQVALYSGYAIVFVPRASRGSGGNRIATIGGRDKNQTLHEWGHAFASLQEEVATDNGFQGEVQSWVNVSESESPKSVPWAHWIEAGAKGVGVYEGAAGRVRGAFKPTASGCRMENGEFFCAVCREALILKLYEHVDPIDRAVVHSTAGADAEGVFHVSDTIDFEVQVLEPKKHKLEVEWYVIGEEAAPEPSGEAGVRPRTRRGPLPNIVAKPEQRTRPKRGTHSFRVKASRLEPGRYRVIVRVRDTTRMRGEKLPWVLKDDYGLLTSERGWWIEVAR